MGHFLGGSDESGDCTKFSIIHNLSSISGSGSADTVKARLEKLSIINKNKIRYPKTWTGK